MFITLIHSKKNLLFYFSRNHMCSRLCGRSIPFKSFRGDFPANPAGDAIHDISSCPDAISIYRNHCKPLSIHLIRFCKSFIGYNLVIYLTVIICYNRQVAVSLCYTQYVQLYSLHMNAMRYVRDSHFVFIIDLPHNLNVVNMDKI